MRKYKSRLLKNAEFDMPKCEFRQGGLTCLNEADFFVYDKEYSGYYCERHMKVMEDSLSIPTNLFCKKCGGRNLIPGPSIYFKSHIKGWGCLDCQKETTNGKE